METLRACLRYNEELDCGFLFINNHQRKRHMTEKRVTADKPLEFCVGRRNGNQCVNKVCVSDNANVTVQDTNIVFDNINITSDAVLVIPYNLPVKTGDAELRLTHTNASYLGCFGGKYYFYSDEPENDVYFEWSDHADHADIVRLLTTHDAEHFLVNDDGTVGMLPDIHFEKAGEVIAYHEKNNSREYELTIRYDEKNLSSSDIFLELDFGGDRAELYADGKLIDDWFSNGELWRVALKRYDYPEKLVLKLYPFDDKVYYDLEPKKECVLAGAELTRGLGWV